MLCLASWVQMGFVPLNLHFPSIVYFTGQQNYLGTISTDNPWSLPAPRSVASAVASGKAFECGPCNASCYPKTLLELALSSTACYAACVTPSLPRAPWRSRRFCGFLSILESPVCLLGPGSVKKTPLCRHPARKRRRAQAGGRHLPALRRTFLSLTLSAG